MIETQSSNAAHMEMDSNVARATAAFEQMRMAPSALERIQGAVGASTTIVENTTSIADTWDPLLQRLKLFTDIVDGISEV